MAVPSWYVAGVFAAILASVGAAALALHHREKPGAVPLAVLLAGQSVWAGSTLLELTVHSFWLARRMDQLSITATAVTVTFFAVFVIEFLGLRPASRRSVYAGLSIEPGLATLLVWTNPVHELFWRVSMGTAEATAAFWGHIAYSYGVLLVVTVMIVAATVRAERPFQRQYALLLVGTYVPWIVNVLYLFGPLSTDLTPLSFTVSGVALFLAAVRYGFMDLAPVARDTLVDTMDDAMVVLDEEGRVIDTNPAFESLLAVEGPVVGRRIRGVIPDGPALQEVVAADSGDQSVVTLDTAASERHFEVSVSPISGNRQDRVGWLVLLHDVTERRRRERELERKNERLEQVASVISHDLQNPLTIVNGRADLARETGDLSHLDEVDRATDRMERIIEDVLSLARQGQRMGETERLELERVAREAWLVVDTADASLAVEDDRVILADESRLAQVFENLYRNAVQHGGPDVTVRVGPTAEGFYVEDDGPGIPEDEREAVFDAGFTDHDDGTGLGLAIVETIAEAHGWSVTIGTSASGGARFEFAGVEVPTDERRPVVG